MRGMPIAALLVVGATAIVTGGAIQSWALLCFGTGLMGSTTVASVAASVVRGPKD